MGVSVNFVLALSMGLSLAACVEEETSGDIEADMSSAELDVPSSDTAVESGAGVAAEPGSGKAAKVAV